MLEVEVQGGVGVGGLDEQDGLGGKVSVPGEGRWFDDGFLRGCVWQGGASALIDLEGDVVSAGFVEEVVPSVVGEGVGEVDWQDGTFCGLDETWGSDEVVVVVDVVAFEEGAEGLRVQDDVVFWK